MQEVVSLRIVALNSLVEQTKYLVENVINGTEIKQSIQNIRALVAESIHDIWKVRLTTSTHMIRGENERQEDTVFFYNDNPFESNISISDATNGPLSDGGIQYNKDSLLVAKKNTPKKFQLPFSDYLQAKGGNFSGIDFINHPIFLAAIGNDKSLMVNYVLSLHLLDLSGFYNLGLHSGWRPGEMKTGYGRPISLGYKGEAFYPPNNSTVDHAAIVIPNKTKTSK